MKKLLLILSVWSLVICSNVLATPVFINDGPFLTSNVEPGTAGANLTPGMYEDAQARWFTEKQNFTLTADLVVDINAPYHVMPSGGGLLPPSPLSPSTLKILAGTVVNSYIFHFDPVGSPNTSIKFAMQFDPGETILGVMVKSSTLSAGLSQLGLASLTYPNYGSNNYYGLENVSPDLIYIPDSMARLYMTSGVNGSGIDDFRVITSSRVPEPTTLLLLGIGLIGLAGLSRKKFLK